MAIFRQLMVQDKDGWYLMNPKNPWEALKIAFYLYKYPNKVGVLIHTENSFILDMKPYIS